MPTVATRLLTVEWVDGIAEYRRRVTDADRDTLPVLRPDAADRADRWAAVLRLRFVPESAPLAPGTRLVVAWGEVAAATGRQFARRTGAACVAAAGLDEVLAAVGAAPSPTHVVVLAAADLLTVAAIGRLSSACRAVGARLGLLCGRDEAALSFAAAKASLRPDPALSGVDVLDAPEHRSAGNLRRLPPDYQESLRRPSLAKLLRTHGEGGHAKLPDVVVCGLLDPVEFPAAPEAGCSRTPRRCKRAEARGASVVFADELTAPIIAFVCCNGFNVAGELYPSPVSMALGMAEGEAGAVLAPVRPLVATDAMVALVQDALAAGRPLGDLVADLNELGARIGQRDAFVLHGDPGALPPAGTPRTPAVPGGASAGDQSAAVLTAVRDRLVLTLTRAVRGRRLLRSIRAWRGDRDDEDLTALATRLDRLEATSVNAVKWAETDPAGESLDRLARAAMLVRLGVAGWDRAMARFLVAARDSVDAFDAGHYDQVLAEVTDGAPCARCATPTEVHRFGRAEPADEARAAVLCRVCGPVSEGRVAGLRLAFPTAPGTATADAELVLTAELTPPAGPLPVESVALHLRFFDKANDVCVHDEARTVPAAPGPVEFRVALPPDLGVDLHSVRLVGLCGFDVAYARARFAGLPGGGRG
jgi:hypothetical protein